MLLGVPERTVRHAGSEREHRGSTAWPREEVRGDECLLPPTFNECCIGRIPGDHNAVHVPWEDEGTRRPYQYRPGEGI